MGRPACLTAEIGDFLDRVWTGVELPEPRA
jgi:hypothetical protein